MTDNIDNGCDYVLVYNLHILNILDTEDKICINQSIVYEGVLVDVIRHKTNNNKSKVIIQNG